MLLEARPTGWFTNTVELHLNGNFVGTIRPNWFNEGMELNLLQHPVRFEKPSWMRSHFVLKDEEGNELGSATLEGVFRQRWEMNLKSGPGILQRAGWLTAEYVLKQNESITARVNMKTWFSRSWTVVADDTLTAVDVLLIGLVYTVVKHREARQHSG